MTKQRANQRVVAGRAPCHIACLFCVVAGVPPAVEPGILPGGLSCGLRHHFRVQSCHSGRQDAALYGSQDVCRYSLKPTLYTYRFAPVRRRAELPSRKVLPFCPTILKRTSSSSPRDAGVGRGPRRGASKAPPLPGPLFHPMEERESLPFPPGRAEDRLPCRGTHACSLALASP